MDEHAAGPAGDRAETGDNRAETGEISVLTPDECWQFVDAATIGRVGFVADDAVQIIPVNYLVADGILIRTLPDGVIAAQAGQPVAFHVDYHDASGIGWSVLMHGPLLEVDAIELDRIDNPGRVLPWAGGRRDRFLRLQPTDITGRRVHRIRNT
ncbi:pyridoxamine 5'-phosphate oxidase family protein [Microlunatus elymi]|uniref:Pyridoxamine 5'-phosphate oxidase family protein n=1 Tax=Microlunatus elymi TaxID=2596828 RepID=A0A516Q0E2_9ACTN|nr:pyridoxamine 5'-phosphate oxidase family protein [Microlunatus elymi]QDP96671.1 pyridoxamine 5'-phosphate oxidase family protein [Microlunatus elymi]